jgi:CRP-like cAMP-binding protein
MPPGDPPHDGAHGPAARDAAAHCSADVRLEMLGRAPLFRALDEDALARVNERCSAVPCVPGETIHHEGDPAERLFVVATGVVELLTHGAEGRRVLHDVVVPGETFGSLPVLGDDRYRHDAVALRPGCLLRISSDTFRDLLREVPGVAEAALEVTAQRLRDAQRSVHDLSTLPVDGRLAATLLRLAAKTGEQREDGLHLGLPLPQVDLAAMTGTSPESVSRVFGRWRAAGWIATGGEGPVLRDAEALRSLAEGDAVGAGDASGGRSDRA